jgi:hypothetical protein
MSAADWPVDAREAVLVHERAHVYWLNPLAWIAALALEREREAACDEEVLQAGIRLLTLGSGVRGLAPPPHVYPDTAQAVEEDIGNSPQPTVRESCPG